MVSVEIQLHNPSGLHLRPAGILCKAATKFQSHVAIRTADGTEVNAKSVLSVLSACIKTGDVITMICDGSDETEALAHDPIGARSAMAMHLTFNRRMIKEMYDADRKRQK